MKRLLIIFLFVTGQAVAQDTLYKKDLSRLIVKVKQIDLNAVFYALPNEKNDSLYTISFEVLDSIRFSNGVVRKIEVFIPAKYSDDTLNRYRHAVLVKPFSMLSGYFAFGYQYALKRNRFIIAELGMIGVRIGDFVFEGDKTGLCLKFGYRIKKYTSLLQEESKSVNFGGFYIQPEIAFSTYDYIFVRESGGGGSLSNFSFTTSSITRYTVSQHVNSLALMFGIGDQVILGNKGTLDLGISVGIAPFTMNLDIPNNGNGDYHFTHNNLFETIVATKLSFTLGYILN